MTGILKYPAKKAAYTACYDFIGTLCRGMAEFTYPLLSLRMHPDDSLRPIGSRSKLNDWIIFAAGTKHVPVGRVS